jgi:hypothetical protein
MRSKESILYHIQNQCHNLDALKQADKTLTLRKQEELLSEIANHNKKGIDFLMEIGKLLESNVIGLSFRSDVGGD